MAKHLNQQDINAIVNLIRGWGNAKLTWPSICEAAESLVGKKPTRQSLCRNESIRDAYKTKKKNLKESGVRRPRPASLEAAGQRIANLESLALELKEENRRYKQQYVIWQYNAYKYGLTEEQLNEPLPMIDRERTDGEMR